MPAKPPEQQLTSRRDRKREDLYQRIIATAMNSFDLHGFDQVTMESIAEKADITKATLYRYFPVKEAILAGFFRNKAKEKVAVVDKIMSRHASTRKRLEALIEANAPDLYTHSEYFSIYIRFRFQHLHNDKMLSETDSGQHAHVMRIIAEGVKQGDLRSDIPVPLLAVQLELTLIFAFFSFLKNPAKAPSKKTAAALVDFYLGGAGNG